MNTDTDNIANQSRQDDSIPEGIKVPHTPDFYAPDKYSALDFADFIRQDAGLPPLHAPSYQTFYKI